MFQARLATIVVALALVTSSVPAHAADSVSADGNATPAAPEAAAPANAKPADTGSAASDSAAPVGTPAATSPAPNAAAPGTLAPAKPAPAGKAVEETDDKASDKGPAILRKHVAILPYAPVTGDIPQSTGDRIQELFRDEVAKVNEIKLVDVGTSGESSAKKPGDDEVSAARAKLVDALAQLDKVKPLIERHKIKPAVDAAEAGIKDFLTSFEGASDFKALSDAYARLAIIRFLQGDDEGAVRAFDDLIRIDPARALDAGDFRKLAGSDVSDDLVDRFKKERLAVLSRTRGRIRVESIPAGAKVVIDGVPVGEAPLLAKAALPGEHYVVVSKEGAGTYWKTVTVREGPTPVVLSAPLTADANGPVVEISKKLNRNLLDAEARALIKSAGELAGADFIVFGGVKPDGDTLLARSFVMRISDGSVSDLAAISLDPNLLGAGIEVVKVANDLFAKIQSNDFGSATEASVLFEGVAAIPEEALAVTEVVIAPPSADAPKAPEAVVEAPVAQSHRRGPVTAGEDVAPAAAEKPKTVEAPVKSGESALEQLEERRRAREHGSRAVMSDETRKTDEAQPGVGEQIEPPKEELNLTPNEHSSAGLSVDQLRKLTEAQDQGSTRKVILWTSVGVASAAVIVVGAILLFHPTTPSTAAATVSWHP